MTRKLVALLATTLLLFALLPAAAAFAAASGTAQLTTATTTFPRENTVATVRVNNTEAPVVGKTINYVDIILPAGTAGVVLDSATITAPGPNWTVKKDVVGTFQAVTFIASTGGIAPGQNLAFNIPVDVTRPANSDRSGAFNVAVSSNGGANTKAANAASANALTMNVKILQLEALAPTAPAGVTDNTATGGQDIDISYAVRNHALQAVNVTSALTSSDATDVTGGAKVTSVPGDPSSVTTLTHDVLLGPAKSGDRTSTFTASATSTGASAAPASRALTVQWEPDLSFNQLSPNRVRSGLGANYTFQVNAAKIGTPALNDANARLSFAQTSTDIEAPTTFAGGSNSKVVRFKQVEVAGAGGTYTPMVSFSATDANGKALSGLKPVDTSLIIDNLAPIIRNLLITIPQDQTAVKDGDALTVTGCISNAVEDIRLNSLRVVLDPNVGNDIVVTASTTTGTAGSGCDYTFSGSASGTQTQWAAGATSVKATAEVADTAGNIGSLDSPAVTIDQILPVLQDGGRTESATTIRVQFTDDLTSAIEGGCDPASWSGNGVAGYVDKVTYSGETESCLGKASDGSGVRILHLRPQFAMDQDDTPKITYNASPALINSDPAQDGARNNTITTTISTVSGIIPPAPTIVTVERNNGTEQAYSEADAQDSTTNYYTRFPGGGATEDLTVTFGGARNNYLIQVLDGSRRVLSSQPLNNPAMLGSREFNAETRVPIGGSDGTYRRGLRLVGNGNEGDITWFDVVLDTVQPTILRQSLQSDGQTVIVDFREPLVGGTDFANDWVALESTNAGDQWYRALDVISTDADTRTVTFPLQSPGDFENAFYRLTSDGGVRYEDRGGNLMADTLSN